MRGRRNIRSRASSPCLAAAAAVGWEACFPGNHAAATTFDATWIGLSGIGGTGSWNAAANWSNGALPNNGTPTAADRYNVFIDGGKPAASNSILNLNQNFAVNNVTVSTINSRSAARQR